jgi:predicted transcriptional regulator
MNKVLKFGIAPVPVQRARTLAIAAGTRQRSKDEPNVWFPTVTAMARVLSDENMALLKVIRESHPDSMDALAKAVGKHAPNVSRSLHTMSSSPSMAERSFRRQPPRGLLSIFPGVADITSLDQAISANIVSLFHWGNPLVLPFRGDGLI